MKPNTVWKKNKIEISVQTDQEKKREDKNPTNPKNEKGDITTNSKDIKMIIKEYCEQFYVNKLNNINEVD